MLDIIQYPFTIKALNVIEREGSSLKIKAILDLLVQQVLLLQGLHIENH